MGYISRKSTLVPTNSMGKKQEDNNAKYKKSTVCNYGAKFKSKCRKTNNTHIQVSSPERQTKQVINLKKLKQT